ELQPGELFYDFSNQPALYPWSGRLSPTRFFTAFYASGIRWQDEVIADLETKDVRAILWRGPHPYWNAPDGYPNYLRQWRIATHLLRHYRPARELAAGSLLLRREDAPTTLPAAMPELWREPVDYHALPEVWGRSQSGVPP